EARDTFEQSMGINWNMAGGSVDLGSGVNGSTTLTPRVNVENIPATAAAVDPYRVGMTIGTLDVVGNLTALLALAERDTLAKVISSPRILAMNKEEAIIRQEGEQVSISVVTDASGVINKGVQRTPVVVQLKVTPQVTDDSNVIMDVEVQREFVGPQLDEETLAREINKRSAKTKILVKNGQTAVIGGIYQSEKRDTTSGLPGLHKIPVLGWLFKSKQDEADKNELLIFLTPRILNSRNQTAAI
ncbi:MAG: type IV pilus secretin PilQ, partial [Bdellovibrionales bacterium]|nr:type IV pilus secretin PilQ [Bdellovibrionales bacterium]